MTTDDLITRARRAIVTGQPRLAQLYMRKALGQTEQLRRKLNPFGFAVRKAGEAIGLSIGAVGVAVKSFLEGLKRAVAAEELERKRNYVLAGPAK